MHDVLRQRLLRKIESLPDEQVYQVLDYIEFLESKYAATVPVEASGLQKFAEGLEDKLRRKAVSPSTIREAFQLISAADRVLAGVSSAGRQILSDLNQVLEPGAAPEDGPQVIEADPRKSGSATRTPATTAVERPARPATEGGKDRSAPVAKADRRPTRDAPVESGTDRSGTDRSGTDDSGTDGATPEPEGGASEDG